ncbi:MAG TPA: glycosyltransferase family 4 protein [Gemmatimonadales bacterium]|nr:glycosyltransferase family 4 protein [Gemmatimonadales bacterium]
MRLTLLTSANGWRGSGVSYAKIARGLLDRGHDVRLVTAVPRLTARLEALGLPVTEIPGRDTGPREVLALLRALRAGRSQALIVDTPRDVRLSAYATLLHRAPIVYRYNLNYRRPRTHLMDRVYLSRLAGLVYQSRWIRDDALAFAPWLAAKPSWRVPNGYDTERYAPRPEAGAEFRARHGIAPDAVVALTLAKLARHKGQEVAMAALERLRADGADIVYVVCGDGAREGELREIAAGLRLPTIFTGLLEPDGVIAALAAADVVVHPSLREIFPNAVGEAMACGRAVVAVDGGGTGELIGRDGSAGLLVPPEDPDAMALAVGALIDDPTRRAEMGRAARRRIETEFPLARMVDGYERALGEVVGR